MYYFIVNPSSGDGKGVEVWNNTKKYLNSRNIDYEVYFTTGQGDARNKAKELTESYQGPLYLVVIGGDGTINEVVDGAVVGQNVAFGFIPAGSGNDLCKGLGLPSSTRKSIRRALADGKIDKLDYGVVSCGDTGCIRRFMVSSGIGFDAAVCHSILNFRSEKKKRPFLPADPGYMLTGIREFLAAKPSRGYIVLDDSRRVEFNNILFISAHICPFEGGGFKFAPAADPKDGSLSVCVVSTPNKLKLVSALLWARSKGLRQKSGVRFFECRELRIHTDKPMAVHTDGESCKYQTDITIRCIPGQLKLVR